MSKSAIEWTDDTWNPVSGCTRVSAGCDRCYAVKMTKRLEAMGQEKYSGLVNIGKGHFNGTVRCHEDALTIPLKARKPRRWFVNSMSDLFHREVPFEFIDKVFAVMALTPHHTYQILTKRPERMAEYLNGVGLRPGLGEDRHVNVINALHDGLPGDSAEDWTDRLSQSTWPLPGVWLGTSVEDQATADERIPHLLRCPAAVRFLSCAPLLGPVKLEPFLYDRCADCMGDGVVSDASCDICYGSGLDWKIALGDIHWVIAGGESGPGARPMHPDWARSLRDQCVAAGVPFFFKQWGEWVEETQLAEDALIPAVKCYEPWSEYDEAEQCFFGDRTAVWKLGKKSAGRILDGRTWDELPEVTP